MTLRENSTPGVFSASTRINVSWRSIAENECFCPVLTRMAFLTVLFVIGVTFAVRSRSAYVSKMSTSACSCSSVHGAWSHERCCLHLHGSPGVLLFKPPAPCTSKVRSANVSKTSRAHLSMPTKRTQSMAVGDSKHLSWRRSLAQWSTYARTMWR